MGGKTAELPCMEQKRRGIRVLIQMPDMAEEHDVIPRFDLLHDIGQHDGRGVAQDRQAVAI